jgi:hypothetical protein
MDQYDWNLQFPDKLRRKFPISNFWENVSESQSQNYFITGSLPPWSSWQQVPWDSRLLIFFFQRNTWAVVVHSGDMNGLSFKIVAGPRQRSHSWPHFILSQIRDSPNLEGQDPVFISPRNRVARLQPQGLSSLFVASYDSQGYGVGIRPHPSF